MNIPRNARLTPLRREEMALSILEGGLSKAHAARMHGVSPKIVARWVERYGAEGRAGMFDRSSRPHVTPGMTRQDVAERIVALRRQRLTGRHIALVVGVSPATVSRVLRRAGLSRHRDLERARFQDRVKLAEPRRDPGCSSPSGRARVVEMLPSRDSPDDSAPAKRPRSFMFNENFMGGTKSWLFCNNRWA